MPSPLPADLSRLLERNLPAPLLQALRQALSIVGEMEVPCYLVGGPVRDLLLGRPVDDLDLVLEGDAVAVAERFAQTIGHPITRHTAFRTAKVLLGTPLQPFHIDFVTARSEHYPEPAALPVVRPSALEDDLRRRDFTINTLAISLTGAGPFRLIDLCGGLDDLEGRAIRILHERSFIDDPTRILRAARFAARLGFGVEERTRRLLVEAADAGMIDRTSPVRILHELWLTFEEPAPEAVLRRLHELGVLGHVLPGLDWTAELGGWIAAIGSRHPADERRLLILGLLAWSMVEPARRALLRRYPLTTAERRVVTEMAALDAALGTIMEHSLLPSELDRLLHGLSSTARAIGELVASPPVRAAFAHYRQALRPVRTLLTGDDLQALGISPGPRYRILLQDLRAAQLDGQVRTRAEAERWVRERPMDTHR